MAVTPMMQQYLDIKAQHTDAILLFRIGDFYEMFYDDAKTVSRELELTLTGKDCGEAERAPMCGVPYHAADSYVNRLVAKGHKVVICEQVEDPASAKGLVKRDIVRIVTPGTVIDSSVISDGANNYLAAIAIDGDECSTAFVDISTGDISATSFKACRDRSRLISELATYKPSEVLLNCSSSDEKELCGYLKDRLGALIWESQTGRFEREHAYKLAGEVFGDQIDDEQLADIPLICAIGALIDYIRETQKLSERFAELNMTASQATGETYIKKLNIYSEGQFLELDASTRRNLELTETMRSKEKRGSLLWVLDKTVTSMGARLLRKWVELPLVNVGAINRRQSAVAELADDVVMRSELTETLKGVLDLERLMAKIMYGTANARDVKAVGSTASVIPKVRELLSGASDPELCGIARELDELSDIRELIDTSIADNPPFSVREGGFIKDGASPEIDELRDIMNGGHGLIEKIENSEREKTGIQKLKVGYNRVFGYYIELPRSQSDAVPQNYVRKQTLANCERYITDELKKVETTVLGASDKVVALEYELFTRIREQIASQVKRVQQSAARLALLDVYLSLAEAASSNNYTRPYVEYGDVIKIKDGRHPVVEKFVKDSYFVPNDTLLDTSYNRLSLITGPNMAGKSTYMRQVALIVVMAQLGSFVPASDAEIGVTDKIFTRVGASDDLAAGQSTFMLEMTEVAGILKNATKRSLIIYDEIGRGTSTYDGMSIARAVIEYTLGRKLGAKTLFATHYHELTELEGQLDGVVNYNIAAKKKGDDITFLRKIIRGSTDDSYGIEVAKLAGVPTEVIRRAKEILTELEKRGKAVSCGQKTEEKPEENANVSFSELAQTQAVEKLKKTEVDTLTPIEALNLLYELKNMLL